ncbi:hypothetical protein EMIT047CA2_60259 [Pseudomonas soli]
MPASCWRCCDRTLHRLVVRVRRLIDAVVDESAPANQVSSPSATSAATPSPTAIEQPPSDSAARPCRYQPSWPNCRAGASRLRQRSSVSWKARRWSGSASSQRRKSMRSLAVTCGLCRRTYHWPAMLASASPGARAVCRAWFMWRSILISGRSRRSAMAAKPCWSRRLSRKTCWTRRGKRLSACSSASSACSSAGRGSCSRGSSRRVMDSSLLIRKGVGASSLMQSQLRLNEIDSQVLIPQRFVMSIHVLTHFCYHRCH